MLRRENGTDWTARECRNLVRQAILSTEKPPMRAPQAMKQPVRHARAQRGISDDMLALRMRGPTTQDSTVPARVLPKAVSTIVVTDRQLKRRLNTIEEETRWFARPIMVTVIGAAVSVFAVVGAVNKAPARLASETLQRRLR